MTGDPRTDPVGTVRVHEDGRTVVKVSMGDDTGKGQHVWCRMDDGFRVRWLHHNEVYGWSPQRRPEELETQLATARAEVVKLNTCVDLAFGWHHSGGTEGPCVECGRDAPCRTRLALIGTHEEDVFDPEAPTYQVWAEIDGVERTITNRLRYPAAAAVAERVEFPTRIEPSEDD